MNSEMGNVTQLAYRAVTDEQLLMEQYSTPESVLDYLQNEANFKSLSEILKETIVKAGICNESDEQSLFAKELSGRLLNQYKDCEIAKKSSSVKTKVKRWLSGYTKSFDDRYTAIEVCFALGLNLELSRTFLNKCGYNSFNVRNAEDATYLYCIINKRPLSAARKILSEYQSRVTKPAACEETAGQDHSGETTIMLENTLENSSWESDDDFLDTYLIPQKDKFIGYTITALNKYYKWKNNLWYIVIADAVKNESMSLKIMANAGDVRPTPIDDFFPILNKLKSVINEQSDEGSVLHNVYKTFKEDIQNTDAIMFAIKKNINDFNDLESQKQISSFLSEIMTSEGLLKRTITCLLGANDRLREHTDSSLGSVKKDFPDKDVFSNFEDNPDSIIDSLSVRRAFVLMYYIAYAYEFSSYFADENYNSELFGEMGFVEFFEGLNATLMDCHLHPLYPANQFDWLILRSVREFEVSDYDEGEGDPVAFFNDVLSFSFEKTPE